MSGKKLLDKKSNALNRHSSTVLIIGSGAAGLSAALRLADTLDVAVICKDELTEGSTFYAQGGIAAVMGEEDSVDSHIKDTLIAGAGLCSVEAVTFTAERAREAVLWLVEKGVAFTTETRPDGQLDFHLTQEAGHSHRRILHAHDATGFAIENTLVSLVRQHPRISLYEHYTAIDLIKSDGVCTGAYVLNNATHQVEVFQSYVTLLATGGASKVYLYTSNPDATSGDGIAMAWRAGCRVGNMEFNQFHPTCLYHSKAKSFLITEAVRGEGGILKLPDGTRFMPQFDKRGELAPRDIVARAIDHEMKRLGIECVFLDISHKSAAFITSHFPNVYQRCLDYGFDITQEAIPVVPAAHYTCGGVLTDLTGKTDLPGLYAVGEVAFTGLHGANRMASNSLLECIVFAASASQDILMNVEHYKPPSRAPSWDESQVTDSDEEVVVSHNWHELRQTMWDYVGIVRTNKRLQRALRRVSMLNQEIHEYYAHFKVTKNLIELRNLALVAQLIIESAIARKESRGLHYNLDYSQPLQDSLARSTILTPLSQSAEVIA
ncbi:MAG: L-aspartate oxidase [Gammaproteobacteria bacterium]|nr:L-aspartate oxidase [Gammaproteobacteria bacterium]